MSVPKSAAGIVEDAKNRAIDARHDFLLALKRIQERAALHVRVRPRQKITPAMVAKEAERARSQLYATHRDVLEKISEANAKRDLPKQEVNRQRRKTELELRALIATLSRDKELLAQQNYRLQAENDELRSEIQSATVVSTRPAQPSKGRKQTRRT